MNSAAGPDTEHAQLTSPCHFERHAAWVRVVSPITGHGSVGSAAGTAGQRVVRLHQQAGATDLSPTAAERAAGTSLTAVSRCCIEQLSINNSGMQYLKCNVWATGSAGRTIYIEHWMVTVSRPLCR